MKTDEMNLNLLKTFYNVAREKSITKTAEKYYTSQPSISRAIKQLENIYNSQLFYRSLNGVELTEKGLILYESVSNIFEILNSTEIKIGESDNLKRGRLYIGVPSQIGILKLFDEIAKFHKIYPTIDILIVSKSTSQLINLLNQHEIDFIIDTAPINTSLKNLTIKKIQEYKNCFFVSNQFAIPSIKKITNLNELENFPIILPVPDTANRKMLNELLHTKNISLKNILNIHTSEMIIGAVKKGAGIGYVIEDLIKDDVKRGELMVLPIKDNLPLTEICLAYENNNLSKISRFFIETYLNIDL